MDSGRAYSVAKVEEKWQRKSARTVYDGRVKIVEHGATLPTGEDVSYEVDESLPFAVAVLLQRSDGRIALTRQYRFPLDRWIYDLPGGAGNPGESPNDAAARECREEIGLYPFELKHLYTFHANPGRTAWPVHLFFSRAAVPGRSDSFDPSEVVNLVSLRIDELDELIGRGDIVDPSLLIARFVAGVRGLLVGGQLP